MEQFLSWLPSYHHDHYIALTIESGLTRWCVGSMYSTFVKSTLADAGRSLGESDEGREGT